MMSKVRVFSCGEVWFVFIFVYVSTYLIKFYNNYFPFYVSQVLPLPRAYPGRMQIPSTVMIE